MYLKLTVGLVTACMLNVGAFAAIAAPKPNPARPATQTSPQVSNQLSEQNIRQVLATIQAAIDKKDVAGVMRYMAPFAHSEVTVESDDGRLTVNVDGQEDHRLLLTQSLGQIQNSASLNRQIRIRMSPDGQMAIATIFRARDVTTQQGQRYYSVGTDTIRFALVNNQPRIVSMSLNGWVASRPSLKPQ